jgi:hypothetical protein
MSTFAKTFLILAAVVAAGTLWHGVSNCAAENRFSSVQRAAEGQIERIKAARELAVERIELSQDRPFDQLMRSEEDLIRQIEILERIREQVQDQMQESELASRLMIPEAIQELCASLSEIEVQLSTTKALAKRIEALRQEAEARAVSTGPRTDASPGGGGWNVPSGNGGASAETSISSCASELSPPSDPLAPLPPKGG